MKREFDVNSVGFLESGLEIQYMLLPDDVRSEGHLVLSRQLAISFEAPEGLGGMAVDLRAAIVDLVTKAHDSHGALPVYEPTAAERGATLPFPLDDDDEDVGMGDGR